MGEAAENGPGYKLKLEKPLIEKIIPRGGNLSRVLSHSLRPLVDSLLAKRITSYPNEAVQAANRANWLNFAVRVVGSPLARAGHIEVADTEEISPIIKNELDSGMTKLTTRISGKKVTSFIAPSHFVPYSLRANDILPDKDGEVAVSASLRHLSKTSDKKEIPAIAMTAAGWSNMVLFGDAIYAQSQNGQPVEDHVKRHIKDTLMSIDTRPDATYFTFDDFFTALKNPPGEIDMTTKSPYLPSLDAHWLITRKDGEIQVMSADELRIADEQVNFRSSIASINSTVGYVDESIANKYHEATDLPTQLVNAIVLFKFGGEQRIGSLHGQLDTNVLTMYQLAKKIIQSQFHEAEDIAIGVLDGGGSSGAIVKTGAKSKERRQFDTSTLPAWPIHHEVAMYTALVPDTFVKQKHSPGLQAD